MPFVAWGFFTWAQLSSDRWALEHWNGSATVGHYAVLVQLGAQPLILFGSVVAQLFEPLVFARARFGSDSRVVRSAFLLNSRVTAAAGVVMLAIVVVEWVAHATIFNFVVAPEYWDVSPLLPIAALSGGLFALAQLFAVGSVVLGTSRQLIGPKIGTAILGVILNVAGAYWFGLTGVLIAGVLTALAYGGWVVMQSLSKYLERA
jgi:O-antigen/teichoic acid export membrane protein